jgi:hypothetical protein
MASWEQESAMAVFEQVRQFVLLSGGKTTRLSREQKGRFMAICWIAQIYKYFAQPKASYVDEWEKLPDWQRETDAAIFEAVEQTVMAEVIAA